MSRETIFAIIFGILLGAGVGVFVLFQTNKGDHAKVIPVNKDTSKKQISKTDTQKQQSILQITAPMNNIAVTKNETTIKGKAPKGSLIVIQSPSGNKVFKTEEENFSSVFPLALGENNINISAYSSSSSPLVSTLQIYYVEE